MNFIADITLEQLRRGLALQGMLDTLLILGVSVVILICVSTKDKK